MQNFPNGEECIPQFIEKLLEFCIGAQMIVFMTVFTIKRVGTRYVSPPSGARIDALPEEDTEIQKDGTDYCEFEGALYKKVISESAVWYEVVEDLK